MRKNFVTVAALLLAFSTPGGVTSAAPPKGSPWGADFFPNVPLVTQEGKTVRFYEDLIVDKMVMINFIFTGCSELCPLATAKLVQVHKMLGSRMGRDFFIYSISLDPESDTPAALKAYAGKYGAGGPGWLFLTGKREDVDKVRFKLGERTDKSEHPNVLRVGNGAQGQWMRLQLDGDINVLVNDIGKALDANWYAGKPVKSIAEAPRLKVPEQGELLFANRCSACHTLGYGDRLGPDLKGVTARRERAWLSRYLWAPDRMRAARDPIAVELAAKHDKALMPNLGLTPTQVEEVIRYLEMARN